MRTVLAVLFLLLATPVSRADDLANRIQSYQFRIEHDLRPNLREFFKWLGRNQKKLPDSLAKSELQHMLRGDVIADLDRTPAFQVKSSGSCYATFGVDLSTKPQGIEVDASTADEKRAPICFSAYRLATHETENGLLEGSEELDLIALGVHELAHHFGINDLDPAGTPHRSPLMDYVSRIIRDHASEMNLRQSDFSGVLLDGTTDQMYYTVGYCYTPGSKLKFRALGSPITMTTSGFHDFYVVKFWIKALNLPQDLKLDSDSTPSWDPFSDKNSFEKDLPLPDENDEWPRYSVRAVIIGQPASQIDLRFQVLGDGIPLDPKQLILRRPLEKNIQFVDLVLNFYPKSHCPGSGLESI